MNRVAMVVFSYYPNDVRVRREAEALAEKKMSVDIICLKNEGQSAIENIRGIVAYRIDLQHKRASKLRYLYEYTVFILRAFIRLSGLHLRRRYDIIHVHNMPDILVISAIVPKLMGAKVILDIHDIMPEFYLRKYHLAKNCFMIYLLKFLEKLSVGLADRVFIASPLFREKVIKRSSKPEKCITILNFPDTKYFNSLVENHRIDDKFRVIYPGTLSEIHGVDIAIKAIYLNVSENKIPIEFHIYTDGSDEEQIKAQSLVDNLELQDYIFFHRRVPIDGMSKILKSMDVGLIPKRGGIFADDAMSTKLFEYAAVGLPAIVSRTKSDSLYFDESMVMFFEPENERELADCIFKLYQNPKLRESLSKNAQLLFKNLNWNTIKKDIYATYEQLLF